MTMKWGRITWLLLTLSGVLSACNGMENSEPLEELPAQKIYEQAEILLENNLNQEASDLFAKIERLYPYSKLAKQSLIREIIKENQDHDKKRMALLKKEIVQIEAELL